MLKLWPRKPIETGDAATAPETAEIILNGVRPLSTVPRGETVELIRTAAGRRVNHRLLEMGLTPGVSLQVLQNDGGPLLLAVRGSRLAIGRCMAHKIIVSNSQAEE